MTVIVVAPSLDHMAVIITTDCDMGWIPMNTLEHLQKGNEKLRSLNSQLKSCSENQRTSIAALKVSFISNCHRAYPAINQTQIQLCRFQNYNVR